MNDALQSSARLHNVKYEIRGQLASRAAELEKRGYEITSLNIGNPGLFGFRTPETMRLAMIENLALSEPYCHQKGIFPAREAIALQQQNRGVNVQNAEQVFIGNGVSELIDLSLRALLNSGDEVLVPSPDYPLWSAAVTLNGGVAKFYSCAPANNFIPDPEEIRALIGPRTRAIVIINPNNPSGAVYDRAVLTEIAALAAKHNLLIMADEIYDRMVYDDAEFLPMATLVNQGVCLTFSGLSKIYRACGYRVGWCVFSGDIDRAGSYMHAMELLSALRLCANVPGQWAVQTALGGYQSIVELIEPGGRLYEQRKVIIERVAASPYLSVCAPRGAMYAFIKLDERFATTLSDQAFALELLDTMHVLVAPGSSFNTSYTDHFRITILPDPTTLHSVFDRIESMLDQQA
jgi:alanine-synthesizing transaminase